MNKIYTLAVFILLASLFLMGVVNLSQESPLANNKVCTDLEVVSGECKPY
jgi:hypothetical protein